MLQEDDVALGRQEYEDMLVNEYYSRARVYEPDVFKTMYSELPYPSELIDSYPPFTYVLKIDTDKTCHIACESHGYNSNYVVINLWRKSYKIKCNKCKGESREICFKGSTRKLIDNHLRKTLRRR